MPRSGKACAQWFSTECPVGDQPNSVDTDKATFERQSLLIDDYRNSVFSGHRRNGEMLLLIGGHRAHSSYCSSISLLRAQPCAGGSYVKEEPSDITDQSVNNILMPSSSSIPTGSTSSVRVVCEGYIPTIFDGNNDFIEASKISHRKTYYGAKLTTRSRQDMMLEEPTVVCTSKRRVSSEQNVAARKRKLSAVTRTTTNAEWNNDDQLHPSNVARNAVDTSAAAEAFPLNPIEQIVPCTLDFI
ncbi:unnamed protein product [Anisakis simplex]|uniref:Uncharacterized protein n=1 Tax=Anisakis simplex TaxID=6269 RepID=A0A0M3K3B5_ANISI|nr:unnamed protein product [Anisakis simplex]